MSDLDLDLPPVDDLDPEDAAALFACQSRVLALLSGNATRRTQLDEITRGLEGLVPDSSCAVMLLDPSGGLREASAPTLPASYLEAIDGLAPGPEQIPAFTAYLAERFVVENLAVDGRWHIFRDVAVAAGYRSCWSTPVLGRSGRVVGILAVFHPVVRRPSQRQRHIVERLTYLVSVVLVHASMIGELTVSEGRFRRAFEDNATAMGLLDNRGVFSRVNTAMQSLAGDRLVPGLTKLADVVVPGSAADVATLLGEVRAGRLRQAQCETRVGDGRVERPVSLTMSLVRAADGEVRQVSVTMFDLTERHAAKRERRARIDAELAQRSAEAASHAKSAFLAAVSHEMRTPLQAITGFAELLGTLDLDATHRAEALRHIRAGAAHLLELVDDTLDLSRIEAGALLMETQPVRTDTLVAGVLTFLAPVAAQQDVQIRADSCEGVVLGDVRRLRQILINLVSNGIRYSGPSGVVTVSTSRGDGTVRVVVADNGPGIARELRARLFEPFVHTDGDSGGESTGESSGHADSASTATGVQGIGLGLMLASGLTEAMGGRLTIHDPPTGTGTVATVSLPAG